MTSVPQRLGPWVRGPTYSLAGAPWGIGLDRQLCSARVSVRVG